MQCQWSRQGLVFLPWRRRWESSIHVCHLSALLGVVFDLPLSVQCCAG